MSLQKAMAVQECNAAVMACRVAEAAFLEALFSGRHGNVAAFEERLQALESAEKRLAAYRN